MKEVTNNVNGVLMNTYVYGVSDIDFVAGENLVSQFLGRTPTEGSQLYLFKVTKPQGIIGKANVISTSSNEVTFEIIEKRELGFLIPEFVLKRSFPNELWPQNFVCKLHIPIICDMKLPELWVASRDKHCIEQILDQFQLVTDDGSWYQKYTDFVQWFSSLSNEFSDEDLIKIWSGASDISSISPQHISKEQCIENINVLREITTRIVTDPSQSTHQIVKKSWKELTTFSSILHVAINRVFSMVDPAVFTSVVSEGNYFPKLYKFLAPLLGIHSKYYDWVTGNNILKTSLNEFFSKDHIKTNVQLWALAEYLDKSPDLSLKLESWESERKKQITYSNKKIMNGIPVPLNKILYGPPGTGKTHNSINMSLEIIDPEFYNENKNDRVAIKKRFDELLNSNRIGFVTFHQSFSYEDFVEGLKAGTENGVLNYDVEPGVFKSICERASSSYDNSVSFDDFDTALSKMQELSENADKRLILETVRGKQFEIDYTGGGTFKVFPFATESTDPKYVASVANVRKLYLTGSKEGIYNSSYVEGFLLYLKKHCGLKQGSVHKTTGKRVQKPFVLIIDEINRGNISNIFGELITLIEPSKRAGGKEALSVKLPYSKEAFSVPDNLHIIGTMNTADKSLAQLDIALRRRFQFVEMMTDYKLLAKIPTIDGIDIEQMVRVINKRIELLYDREHTIGHSFFLPLEDTPSLELLAEIFELQILPLLEEYFFEDWGRVGMVLGDHLKIDETDEKLRFVVEQFDDNEITQLMGDDWDQTGIQPYIRNAHAFKTAAAYIGIYS